MDSPSSASGTNLVETARAQFLDAISDYSEDRWCAGWMIGIENDVRELGGRFLLMAFAADGWPIGYRAEHGWDPLTDHELETVAAMRASSNGEPSTAARAQFLDAISSYSEARWCAGWMRGVENDVRGIGGQFLLMAFAAGGWPVGYRGEDGWDPLTADELAALPAHLTDPEGTNR